MSRKSKRSAGARAPQYVPYVLAALAAATVLAYWPVLGHDFLNIDDGLYVTTNPHVQQGLSARAVGWALTTSHAANWHPLTWLSHIVDWQIWGRSPRGHHLTSLLLHVANTLLLFWVCVRMTGLAARSAFVAAVFALHPLHVESVAWIAERKDVLSTLFWLLTMLAYERWVQHREPWRYALVVLSFALGLMAKPMLVTLPCVLLVLDVWPLGRWTSARAAWQLVREKLPLFALAAASSIVTVLAQRAGGALVSVQLYPFEQRLGNAVLSWARYLGKALWPVDLAVYYPHPGAGIPQNEVAGAALLLAMITAGAVALRRRYPWLLVGWLWFAGTLVPVIGIVQVGEQALADRYTYVPLIGLGLIAAWAGGQALAAVSLPPMLRVVPGVVVVALLLLGTRLQVAHWRDAETLFRHALSVTERNHMAHHNLGEILSRRGQPDEAVAHYEQALELRPTFVPALVNLGISRLRQGRSAEAEQHLREALRLDPRSVEALYNLGILLSNRGDEAAAEASYREALRVDPAHVESQHNLASCLARQGRMPEAIEHYTIAIRLRPDFAQARLNLARALAFSGRGEEARAQLAQARRLGAEPPADLLRALGVDR